MIIGERIESFVHNVRLETRYQALKSLQQLVAPGEDSALRRVGMAMGDSHSVELVINQFGEKLVSAFMKADPTDAWITYQRLRPTTVGEEMAATLNLGEFREIHGNL